MEIIISIVLGFWIMLAGVLCYLKYKKEIYSLIEYPKNSKEKKQ